MLSGKLEDIRAVFVSASLEMSGKSALLLTMLSNVVWVHPRLALNLIRILVTLSFCHRQ